MVFAADATERARRVRFIIFDVEVVFLYPWATAFGRLGFFGLGAAVLFIGLITVPYILEWRRGGLDWD